MSKKVCTMVTLLVVLTLELHAQQTLRGYIFDATDKQPLIGASIAIQQMPIGTTSDMDGGFELTYDGSLPVTLVISYLGYETAEVIFSSDDEQIIYLNALSRWLSEVVVTSRRREEEVLDIPIPIAVLGAAEIDNSVSFNVNRVKELVPSVQLYSSNPRNTTLNIRGLGSTFGLTNDGIDPGVGFYVDGVYYARPAVTTMDFIDVQQIEVIRGPQGTLYGKNTTAGTFNITSRAPTFGLSGILEQTFGNYGFIQTKGSISGPLIADKLAVRLSYSGTQRDGTIYNVRTEEYVNTLNNQGVKAQLLFLPSDRTELTISGDYTRQRPNGYAQVYAGTAPTQRPEFRQFEQIIADLNYELPSRDPFDRLIDHDTPWKSSQDIGGVSINVNSRVGSGVLTSTTAWRSWKWGPSNDRDFTGLSAIAKSQAPSIHHQWSQELRYSGDMGGRVTGTVGVFAFYQKLDPVGSHTLEAGKDQWRFVQNNENPLWQTPGLLEGLRQETEPRFRNFSGALFGQLDWKVSDRFIVNPGLRLNYDQKEVDFNRYVVGGLDTEDPELLALKNRVFTPIVFQADVTDINLSGQIGVRYRIEQMNLFANYSYNFKPVGLNLGGIPTENGEPILDLAVIDPEKVSHIELGLKTKPNRLSTLNLTMFNTDIFDYQTTVRSEQLGVIRGYLANADQVRTTGVELEASYTNPRHFNFSTSLTYVDAKYVRFDNAPAPLELTGETDVVDASGGALPGVSKWSVAAGIELHTDGRLMHQEGSFFVATDVFYRSGFSSNPTPSEYLNISGYSLVNARFGFRTVEGVSIFVWGRNLFNTDYFEQLLAAGGNAGHYAGVLGDPRTYGITMRVNFF